MPLYARVFEVSGTDVIQKTRYTLRFECIRTEAGTWNVIPYSEYRNYPAWQPICLNKRTLKETIDTVADDFAEYHYIPDVEIEPLGSYQL